MIRKGVIAAIALAAAGDAAAEVVAEAPGGFQTRAVVEIAAPPERVWAALAQLPRWWNPAHTYSGVAANLSFTPEAGACLCERWAGGQVQHAVVVLVQPRESLRLSGGLGPLQAQGAAAAWTFTLKPSATGTSLTQTMTVGGWSPTGLEALAAPVDVVLAEQQARLKRYVETGAP